MSIAVLTTAGPAMLGPAGGGEGGWDVEKLFDNDLCVGVCVVWLVYMLMVQGWIDNLFMRLTGVHCLVRRVWIRFDVGSSMHRLVDAHAGGL